MAKGAFYFSHDYGARNDPKLQKVRIKLGHEGKSIYWDLVEMIYEEGGKLLISEIDTYADTLRTTPKCIKSLINDFGLFNKNKTNFWSESANSRLEQRNLKSENARKSAMDRWNKNANALNEDANALRDLSERNALKDSKEKGNDKKDKEKKEDNNLFSDATQSDGIYPKCIELYNNFILDKTDVSAKINGKEGSAMKKIIAYLKTQVKNKENLEIEVPNALSYIFSHFDEWTKFHKEQLNLNQIESNLINIINSIKNGKSTAKNNNRPISKYAS